MASVSAEYFKSVFIKRRWTVMTASPFIVFGIQWLFNHLYGLPSDLRKASIWEAPWWLWALSILCCFSFAQFLAWRDEHRRSQTVEQALRDREEDHRSDRTLRDAVLILSARLPDAPAEVANAVNKLVGSAAPIGSIGAPEKAPGVIENLQPISATIPIRIPNGDILIGAFRTDGRVLTYKAVVNIQSAFTKTATVALRVNGVASNTSIAIVAGTSGRFNDATRGEGQIGRGVDILPKGTDLVEIQGVVTVGDTQYTSEVFSLLLEN